MQIYINVLSQASSKMEPPGRLPGDMILDKILIVTMSRRGIDISSLSHWCGEVERRFEQSDLQLAQEIECLLLSAANRNTTEITDPVFKFIKDDIDKSRLSIQLPMVPTIAQAMDKSNIFKNMLSEID